MAMNLISNESYRNTTLALEAARCAAEYPNKVATRFDNGDTLSFGEAWDQGRRLAAALQANGFTAGDTLSFQLPNQAESVIVAIAASICGLVITPVVPIYRGQELSFILRDARARVVFIPRIYRKFDFSAMLEELKPQLPDLELVVCVGAEGELPANFVHWDEFIAGGHAETADLVDVDPNDTKILLYTSGTTGHPKAVRHSHNTLTAALDNGRRGWSLGPDDLCSCPPPLRI